MSTAEWTDILAMFSGFFFWILEMTKVREKNKDFEAGPQWV